MSEKKLYKPNVVYVVEIHGCQYYVGCHSWKWKKELTESRILGTSGNPLHIAYEKKLITYPEYREYCKLVHIEEYDTKEEAQNREVELIEKFKEHYGNQCLNKSKGNKYGNIEVPCSEETKRKLSEKRKGIPLSEKNVEALKEAWKHRCHITPDYVKKKMSESHINNPRLSKKVQQFTKDGQFIEEYPSASEAGRKNGLSPATIMLRCRGERKAPDGSIWKYV